MSGSLGLDLFREAVHLVLETVIALESMFSMLRHVTRFLRLCICQHSLGLLARAGVRFFRERFCVPGICHSLFLGTFLE